MDEVTASKRCGRCGEVKPLQAFHRSSKGPAGRAWSCKDCFRAYRREHYLLNQQKVAAQGAAYYQANRESVRAAHAAYYARNRERFAERRRAWAAANPGRMTELMRQWRAANADHDREMNRAWTAANLDRRREQRRSLYAADPQRFIEKAHRRRAQLREVAVGRVDYLGLWTGACGLCGEPMDPDLTYPDPLSKSVDHIIPISKGGPHEQANLQFAHLVCNVAKGDRLL